jgi:hypothetical protein
MSSDRVYHWVIAECRWINSPEIQDQRKSAIPDKGSCAVIRSGEMENETFLLQDSLLAFKVYPNYILIKS